MKIFYNGKIYDPKTNLFYSSMIVKDGKIIKLSQENILSETAELIDLKDNLVLPALADIHMHPLMMMNTINAIPCIVPCCHSFSDIQQEIIKKETSPNQWIFGWGFDETKIKEGRLLTRYDLDQMSTSHPICIERGCVHVCMFNSKAIELLNLEQDFSPYIERDQAGKCTGIVMEAAKFKYCNQIHQLKLSEQVELLKKVEEKLLSLGITFIAEELAMQEPQDTFSLFQEAIKQNFKLKVALNYNFDWLSKPLPTSLDYYDKTKQLYISGIKIISDGSISGKNAFLSFPYKNSTDHGSFTTTLDKIKKAELLAKEKNIQLVVHAMGDKAIKIVVDQHQHNWLNSAPSLRIEHATILDEKILKVFKQKNIGIVSQPIFMYAEIQAYQKNLPYLNTIYPYNSIIKNNIPLAFSSDSPATSWADPANPFVAMQAAVTRIAHDQTVINPYEAITIQQAIANYTVNAYKMMGIDQGYFALNQPANFIILNQDILNISPTIIKDTKVLETYLNGKLVYRLK